MIQGEEDGHGDEGGDFVRLLQYVDIISGAYFEVSGYHGRVFCPWIENS